MERKFLRRKKIRDKSKKIESNVINVKILKYERGMICKRMCREACQTLLLFYEQCAVRCAILTLFKPFPQKEGGQTPHRALRSQLF